MPAACCAPLPIAELNLTPRVLHFLNKEEELTDPKGGGEDERKSEQARPEGLLLRCCLSDGGVVFVISWLLPSLGLFQPRRTHMCGYTALSTPGSTRTEMSARPRAQSQRWLSGRPPGLYW